MLWHTFATFWTAEWAHNLHSAAAEQRFCHCNQCQCLCAGAEQLTDLSGHKEVRMQAKVGMFGRGMASAKIQYFVDGQLYGMFKVSCQAKRFCRHA